MKITATFTVKKTEGRKQDPDAIRQALSDALENIQSVFVDDGERDGESEYEVELGAVVEAP